MTGRARRRALAALVMAVAAVVGAERAAAADEALLPERLLKVAQDLERDRQPGPARERYEQLLSAAPDGPTAAPALLGLARLAVDLDDPQRLGRSVVTADSAREALARLEQLQARFPASPVAAEGLWRLALLRLEPGTPLYDAEKALAALTALPTLYPRAAETPRALLEAARLHSAAGRTLRARALAFETIAAHPRDPAAASAWLVLGLAEARLGRVDDALVACGRARAAALAASPALSAVAEAALDAATLVDRLGFGGRRAERPWTPDVAAAVPLEGRVRRLASSPDGRLYAHLPGNSQLLALGAAGRPEVLALPGAETFAVDRWARLWSAADAVLVAPAGSGSAQLAERADIVAVAVVDADRAWVVDQRARRVVKLKLGAGIVASAALGERPAVGAVVADPDGGAWILETRGAQLVRVDAEGAVVRSVPLAGLAKDPLDLARDELGNLYLLDGDAPSIVVVDPEGKPLLRQPLATDGADAPFSKPTLLAVDRAGRVAVYDRSRKRVLWLR